MASSVTQRKPENYMSLGEIEAVGQTFLKVLTQCRHRVSNFFYFLSFFFISLLIEYYKRISMQGAIEGCRNGFMQFCVVLMSSQNVDLCRVPAVILNQVGSFHSLTGF